MASLEEPGARRQHPREGQELELELLKSPEIASVLASDVLEEGQWSLLELPVQCVQMCQVVLVLFTESLN